MKMKWMAYVLVGAVMAGLPALAEKPEGAGKRDEARAEKIAERLGVDKATALKIQEITAKHREAQKVNREAIKSAMEELKALVDDENASDAAIQAQLDKLKRLHTEMQASRQAMTNEISATVGPRKSAEMLLHGMSKMKEHRDRKSTEGKSDRSTKTREGRAHGKKFRDAA